VNWSRAWRKGREGFFEAIDPRGYWLFGWLTPFAWMIGLVILTAVAAIGGVLIAIVFDELSIVDLVKYDKENVIGDAGGSAGLDDWLRWTLVGYIVLGILLLLSTFGNALSTEWTSWLGAKGRLRRERIAEDDPRN